MRRLLIAFAFLAAAVAAFAFPLPLTQEQPVSSSAAPQTLPQVASSANGYAVVWNELGPDGKTHIYLRRFSAVSGAPLDGAPIEVATDAGAYATALIAATADTYAVAWTTPDADNSPRTNNYVVRRLSATTGVWIDAAPVLFAEHAFDVSLGSNGDRVLAVYTDGSAWLCCLRERVIFMDSGPALRTTETSLPMTSFAAATEISIGSNGSDFLIAWIDDPCAENGCDVPVQYNLSVQRVRADGTPLDSAPLVLDAIRGQKPSINWTGSSYVVTWEELSTIKASRIAADGGFARDRHSVLVMRLDAFEGQRIVAAGRDLLLLSTERNGFYGNTAITRGITLDPESLAPTGTPALIAADQPLRSGPLRGTTFAVAALPAGFVAAYEREGRVFSRIFANAARRRAAR
jgi:hypothetical protein